MLNPPANIRAFICNVPIDMRCGFDSLSGMVKYQFHDNPASGDLFVFFSRRKDRLKILFRELDGYVLYCKRLDSGSFPWIKDLDLSSRCEISGQDFALLLASVATPGIKREFRSTTKKVPLHLV